MSQGKMIESHTLIDGSTLTLRKLPNGLYSLIQSGHPIDIPTVQEFKVRSDAFEVLLGYLECDLCDIDLY